MLDKGSIGRGQVWLVKFPFEEDLTQGKDRTCLILGWSEFGPNQDEMIWIMPISTFDGNKSKAKKSDLLLDPYSMDFLSKGSYLRTARVASVGPKSILSNMKYFGTVPKEVLELAAEATIRIFERRSPIGNFK